MRTKTYIIYANKTTAGMLCFALTDVLVYYIIIKFVQKSLF